MAKPNSTREPFKVRLNCLDHYQAAPSAFEPPIWGPQSLGSATQRGSLPHVPIIRVFGATETGQKVCAHIHGAFPYLYIPYTDSLVASDVNQYIRTLRHSVDHALALSYRRNPYDNDPKKTTFVAHISLTKGVPFFGYHVGYSHYLKIYLLNPMHMTRFNDLLQQGAIMARVFQPYEAHLQYLLQWMCDFNLHGCSFISVREDTIGWRSPEPTQDEAEERDVSHRWHEGTIDPEQLLDEQNFPRQSHCHLEIDVRVEDILNRHDIRPRNLHHSFIERLSSLENLPVEEKLVHSMAGLWKDETKRRKKRLGIPISDSSSTPYPPEVLVSMSADPRNDSAGGWIHEEEFRDLVDELSKQEPKARGGGDLSFESFAGPGEKVDGVQTVLESVEELFHETLTSKWASRCEEAGGKEEQPNDMATNGTNGVKHERDDALVDMSSIARYQHQDDDGDHDSDEDVARIRALTQREKFRDAGLDDAVGEGKVEGTVEQIERKAEQLKGATIPADTVRAAEQGKYLKRPASPNSSRGRFKRPKISVAADSEPHRSRRVSFRVRDTKPEISGLAPGRVPDDGGTNDNPPSSQRFVARKLTGHNLDVPPPSHQAPLSSQPSSQGSQKIDFPVVKDPNRLETQLRLSQRSSQNGQKDRSFTSATSSNDRVSSGKSGTLSAAVSSKYGPTLDPRLTLNYALSFTLSAEADELIYSSAPPTYAEVEQTVEPHVIYQDAYYSCEKDVPERPREYAGQEFRLESTTLPYLPPFAKHGGQPSGKGTVIDKAKLQLDEQRRSRQSTLTSWEIMGSPVTYAEVQAWVDAEAAQRSHEMDEPDALDVDGAPAASQIKRKNRPASELSQVDGPTQKNKHGIKYSQKKKSTSVQHETGYMSTMALEVHVNSRADLAPDPERDEVGLVVWCLADEQTDEDSQFGIVVLTKQAGKEGQDLAKRIQKIVGNSVQVDAEDTELDLLNRMVDIVRAHDPDILTGFEVHNSSWGYLIERARLAYEFNMPDELSRMKAQSHGRFGKDADRWGFTHTSTVRITGRHTINIWRAMRSELNLLQYTMENVVFHLLHRRIPHYSFADLTRWYGCGKPRGLARVLEYLLERTRLDLQILDANELIPRTSEQARLLGVDFFSVFSRGSQFKVESLMFRLAKPESFVLVSPSRKQVGAQNALECLPLVMEPQSAFYNSPLLVLDFQSLYPSVMIAYNYCYSTCLGRIVNWRGTNKMGFADFQRQPGLLELVKDKVNIAPNGMMYVRPEMRKSLLAKMLCEILETRVMVKSGMKVDKDDKTLQQLLNNRQLALKLIANVTYGYTSASFSGRMPCSEIADSIVQTGRETLEKAIALIHSVERWGAEVVYGDTDSLFVYLKGRTKDEAFKIGDEIAKHVTDMNPRPVKLKFEKVYHPCVLLAKKRYVGFKYESPTQQEPEFDAKGIETVRRDGTPAEQKIEEKALKLLFRTADLSAVKSYFQAQCRKVMQGRVSVQDFCFAKEVKLGTYADKGPPPPGALIATRRMLRDPRTEPQYGERVPYVVIAGAPGARLWERCVEPERLIDDPHAELDAEYYISKNLIPPLERIFNLVGANVRQWYDEMPKVQRIRMLSAAKDGENGGKGRKTMESYMGSSLCLVCRAKLPSVQNQQAKQATTTQLPLCGACRYERTARTLLALRGKARMAEKKVKDLRDICRSCANLAADEEVRCDSRDCPVMYSRVKANTAAAVTRAGVGTVVEQLEEEVGARRVFEW
ncbi:DNA polymerase zeta [Friedmanniomyces endolithicus]|uniref:DNA polymerase n=1 Tax=Friedmanniomyces endolithicus TaxID=329885 RepID=A0AAN6FFT3_9PEZI|nr:DNA polymerase zeta [Friedmanniomyces endolithicus]KAK0316973.1 DNA polymerase zeta [Friedmanniomyces endolithicus]KAK0973878.1 DNA polymerase zeta [Friedmanniomyces endolithicus]